MDKDLAKLENWNIASRLLAYAGAMELAKERFEKMLELAESSGQDNNVGILQGNLGLMLMEMGDLPAALGLLQRALANSLSHGDRLGEGRHRTLMGICLYRTAVDIFGNTDAARLKRAICELEQATKSADALRNCVLSLISRTALSMASYASGDVRTAARVFDEAARSASDVPDPLVSLSTWLQLAQIAVFIREHDRAIELLSNAEAIARNYGNRSGEAATWTVRGQSYHVRERFEEAIMEYERAELVFGLILRPDTPIMLALQKRIEYARKREVPRFVIGGFASEDGIVGWTTPSTLWD
jgi:tetratricopeptide (TPR) repeat protein